MRVSREFKEAFDLVVARAGFTPKEIEEAKEIVRRDFPAAEASYLASAALIRAGWNPSAEHVSVFLSRSAQMRGEGVK